MTAPNDTTTQRVFDPEAYWEERLAARFHLGGVGSIGLGRRYNEWLYRLRRRIVERAIRRSIGSGRDARILDIGSGTGFYLRLWRSLGFTDVTGSDLTATSVVALGSTLPQVPIVQFDIGDAELPFDPESFDIISTMDVFQHIVDDDRYEQAVRNCGRLLRPGGTLLYADYLAPRPQRVEHEVVRTREAVLGALQRSDLEVIEVIPMFVVMNYPVCARPLARRIWRLLVVPAHLHEALGWLQGAVLYPLDLVLTRFVRPGPAAKLIVGVRRAQDGRPTPTSSSSTSPQR